MSKKNAPMSNGKPKTMAQLGLPKGYRLTQVTRANIVRVALRKQLKKDVMKLVDQEIELIHCCNAYLYPIEMRQEYDRVSSILTGRKIHENFFDNNREIKFSYSGNYIHLGTHYGYSYNKNAGKDWYGIFSTNFLNQFIEDSDIYWTDTISHYQEPAYLFSDRFIIIPQPHYEHHRASSAELWQRLPKKLRLAIMRHCKKCEELKERADRARDKLKMVLAEYSSPVKLGNDIPETVNWMLAAEHMNEQGRLCTDVTSADRVQELRKDLGLR